MKAWLVLFVVGCSRAPAPKHASSTERPWLTLFDRAHQWTLPAVVTIGRAGSHEPSQTATVHCAIKALEHVGTAVVSHLACDRPFDDLSISGQWVAQPQGLYHPLIPITEPDDLATLQDEDLLINDPPRDRDHSHTMGTSTRSVVTVRDQDRWCVTDKTELSDLEPHDLGERRSFTLCMTAAAGIVAASELEANNDGSWRSIQIGASPPLDPSDPMHPPDAE